MLCARCMLCCALQVVAIKEMKLAEGRHEQFVKVGSLPSLLHQLEWLARALECQR